MQEISGKEIAKKIINGLKSKPAPKKILAAILVGEDSASISFLKQKEKVAGKLAINFKLYKFPKNISQENLTQEIKNLTNDENVGGIIIQLPLPKQINSQEILNLIPPKKDVDVLSEKSFENFRNGVNSILPPPVEVVKEILKFANSPINQSTFILIGLGNLVGKPITAWLESNNVKFDILERDNFSSSLDKLKNADVVISATGQPKLINPEMLKENALVVDFGYSFINGKTSGDFNPNSPINQLSNSLKYTPTPGGTGPILVAKIMENFYKLAC